MPYVFALLFFMALVFTVIVWYIDSHNKQKKLSEKEKKLLERERWCSHRAVYPLFVGPSK